MQRDAVLQSWPGPVTRIVPAAREVPRWITGRHRSIAIRVSDHYQVTALCELFGGPLLSTSANLHGRPPTYGARGAALLPWRYRLCATGGTGRALPPQRDPGCRERARAASGLICSTTRCVEDERCGGRRGRCGALIPARAAGSSVRGAGGARRQGRVSRGRLAASGRWWRAHPCAGGRACVRAGRSELLAHRGSRVAAGGYRETPGLYLRAARSRPPAFRWSCTR